jgi:hypothetical protein
MKRAIAPIAVLLALIAASGAGAATIVNGGFEARDLSGWHVRSSGFGNWFAYQGTEAPIGHRLSGAPVQEPPQGAFAAVSDQADPDTSILYQDISLEPGSSYRLSLLAYYDSHAPIAVPTPDTLSVDEADLGGQKNQQFRIDLTRPDAPLDSLDPADILRTLFRTQPGASTKMLPTRLTTDLASLAGQTVRLRIVTAAHDEALNAGVDAVSLSPQEVGRSPSHGSSHGSTRLDFGKLKANRRTGTAVLPVRVPGPGLLTVTGKSKVPKGGGASVSGSEALRKAIRPETAKANGATTVRLHLRPTSLARATLVRKHELRVVLTVVYLPSGQQREVTSLPVVLRLARS